MNRRNLLQASFACLFTTTAQAATPPWSLKLLKGGFDGTAWNGGIAIALTDNWKTYWRVPGDGGIAPSFKIRGENIKSSRIDYPTPERFHDEAGMTIGYKNQVVFPLAVEPLDATKPVTVLFEAFFGVCDVVCIPAQVSDKLNFDPALSRASDQILITQWKKLVPVLKPQGVSAPPLEPVSKATAVVEGDVVFLKLDLLETATDIFVEGDAKHYFGEPAFSQGSALLRISGAKTVDEVKLSPLRVTLVLQNAALEQMVTVL